MSGVLWCDFGKHAFSIEDNDAVQDTVKMKVKKPDGTYVPRTFQRDICGSHVAEAVNFERPNDEEANRAQESLPQRQGHILPPSEVTDR